MSRHLRLVWSNPSTPPHFRSDVRMLRRLAGMLAGTVRQGHIESARMMASVYRLSPLAVAVVASEMFRSGISEEEIRRVV
ncbi:MAG: hypothetical protein N3C59_10380 [Azovibrio sp.]|nr:hypothetical protein [Azovibrio sp.]